MKKSNPGRRHRKTNAYSTHNRLYNTPTRHRLPQKWHNIDDGNAGRMF
jgi:hypothetical protein